MRAGPGENYSVAGVLEKGTQVTKVETKGNWIKIEPPANAYAFVAAKYLTQEAAPAVAANTPPEAPETAPQPMQVQEQQPVVTAPPQPQMPQVPPVRIVSHEGVVGTVGSPTAPTTYKLYDPDTKQDIDFLYPISADVDLSKLVDSRVIVTGEEGIDKRWPNTPIIAIQSIQVMQPNVIKRFSQQDLTPPRQRH